MLELPTEAKQAGVRLRWQQPRHGGKGKADWAIDNMYIGGRELNPPLLSDDFGADDQSRGQPWIETDNAHVAAFCGSRYIHSLR